LGASEWFARPIFEGLQALLVLIALEVSREMEKSTVRYHWP